MYEMNFLLPSLIIRFCRFMKANYINFWEAYCDQNDCSFLHDLRFPISIKNDKWEKALSEIK